jgi:hypothetical protein
MPSRFQFRMYYECPCGGAQWTMEHDCACNDKCPLCDAEIEPHHVEDIAESEAI